ncbi:conserved Plasmodium protein, unknown function [Plasmodium knowlesi strain H]|uniref:Uncharacterized protein n=3 Tax=Plasmodium knowlesi TaxID=5850 RepID=A0A5E7WZP3_PLAKH|nr:conserved Plasmodium protein, unknown function [Plasmodium knowlesi strain H]OTN65746.1 Uncharacterized protein PKNOH_S100031900 [Plasmodium knowlesi]CAA9987684.1 conserved Plasmodium protein, unknown function [Plasmodium knowlesi strain H]SBO26902.1 conserved Plasmodium protein, unknown function [Plasmodium knowlesi strain H]SBO29638.1 conserved Plasmodium protein, unknown function [Plasmodium knowlesi strain H]VVS77158.1 conserved Plasmodium protein, unknown function [Plasmodium knowlesi 
MIKISEKLKKQFLTFEEGKDLVTSTLKTGRGLEILNKTISEKNLLRNAFRKIKIINKIEDEKKRSVCKGICIIQRENKSPIAKALNEFYREIKTNAHFKRNKVRVKFFIAFKKIYGLFKIETACKMYVRKLLKGFLVKRCIDCPSRSKREGNKLLSCVGGDHFLQYITSCDTSKAYTYIKHTHDILKKKIPFKCTHGKNDLGAISPRHIHIVEDKAVTKDSPSNVYTLIPLTPYYYQNLPSIKLSRD